MLLLDVLCPDMSLPDVLAALLDPPGRVLAAIEGELEL